jgi:hypothetical protein
MTNDQIIKLASEANSLTQALDEGGDNPELARRLDWIFNLVSKDDAPLLILAMKILQGKPYGVSTANELTIERIESLAADLGAHSIAPTTCRAHQ